jgi:hypothetical protein
MLARIVGEWEQADFALPMHPMLAAVLAEWRLAGWRASFNACRLRMIW